jgi:gamma-glutamylputrescine oxidase
MPGQSYATVTVISPPTTPSYPATWYAANVGPTRGYEPLRGTVEADVCIVGGGLAGLTTARELLRAGKNVVLLEAERVAWGASGRNGGFVSPGFALGVEPLIARVGLPAARALHALSMDGHDYVRKTLDEIAPQALMGHGWIVALRHPGRDALAAYRDLMEREFGLAADLWSREHTRSILKSERYHEALYVPDAFHIQPLAYALALARDIVGHGGRIHEGSAALGWSRDRGGIQVNTPGGAVRARDVVFCTSGYDRTLFGPLARAVLPVATYIAVTEPLMARADAAIATTAAVSDTRRAGDYYRRLTGGRILWGGRITTRRSEPAQLASLMRGDMTSVYPQLRLPRIDYAWGGLMGYARHKMPIIGPAGDGLWIASAFGGHGLNTTAMAGQLIAGAIAAGDDRWKQFALFGAPWVGGPLGQAGVQLSYWAMQLKDRLDEARAR